MRQYYDGIVAKSREVLIFKCPSCGNTTKRAYRLCKDKTTCKLCPSPNKKNNNVISFKEALKTESKGSHRKVLHTCPTCKTSREILFKSALKIKRCKKCATSLTNSNKNFKGRNNPFYGKKHDKKSLKVKTRIASNNWAKSRGFFDYQSLCSKLVSEIENTGYTCSYLSKYGDFSDINSETLRSILLKNGRSDLIGKNSSSYETHIENLINSNYSGKIIKQDRSILKGKELDILLPDIKIAIEFNGDFWHSEDKGKDRIYHLQKMLMCREKGIRLYTFWQSKWDKYPIQHELFIKKLVSKPNRIYARKCRIVKDKNILKKFIAKNHLQGSAASIEYIGLEYEDNIVAACSVSKHHRGGPLVLNRVCFSNYQVVGGLEKMLKHLNKELVTWSDNCYSPEGLMYKNSGFVYVANLKPDYWYIDKNGKYHSKQSQKKSNTGCPKHMTESEWSKALGLQKVWDCGKIKWKYIPSR